MLSAQLYRDTSGGMLHMQLRVQEYNSGVYQGEYVQNQRSGKGVYYWFSGQLYIGQWSNDTIKGQGTLYFPFGGNFVGFFENNKAEGAGILTLPNGSRLVGVWRTGHLFGDFTRYDSNTCQWMLQRSEEYYATRRDYKRIKSTYAISFGVTLQQNQQQLYYSSIKQSASQIEQKIQDIYESVQSSIDTPYYRAMTEREQSKDELLQQDNKIKIRVKQIEEDMFFHGIVRGSQPEGLGIVFKMNGKLSERGKFENTNLNGPGRVELENGEIYDGIFKRGVIAKGFFYNASNDAYIAGIFMDCNEGIEGGQQKGMGYPYKLALTQKTKQYERMMVYKNTSEEIVKLAQDDQIALRIINVNKYKDEPEGNCSREGEESQKEQQKEQFQLSKVERAANLADAQAKDNYVQCFPKRGGICSSREEEEDRQ